MVQKLKIEWPKIELLSSIYYLSMIYHALEYIWYGYILLVDVVNIQYPDAW
jgi:hypothetical protein